MPQKERERTREKERDRSLGEPAHRGDAAEGRHAGLVVPVRVRRTHPARRPARPWGAKEREDTANAGLSQ